MSHIDPDVLQLLSHPRPAIAAQAQARLFLDMCQNHHVHVLPAAGRAAAHGPQPVRADVHHLTETLGWKRPTMFFDKPEPHGFWLAKYAVVGSTGQRNGSFEGISRRLEAMRFPWPCIEPKGDLIKVMLCVNG